MFRTEIIETKEETFNKLLLFSVQNCLLWE